ncbi:MAG: YbaN family protein [Bacteroidales bacterium]|jgi:uncharacterized membrane protein YbaN (DUF454 family)|nr:YbaN family protein [Bacteroidales bacterium]HOL98031.1 YbaN family protein [Bacteroidales bacterium]HOM36540.1 YbaN family protein [Bacteroidales bacterium]HPD23719.1 YbaN family protein [Bacteroidales bacterium]HRS99834.1 YbaN family protein [Bacteroidales bacterium]
MHKKLLFVSLGTLSMIVGIIGIFVPGLPTTPFLLLAAYMFLKSSKSLYNFIMTNKLTSKYLQRYYQKRGMTVWQKIYSITLMWTMIIISLFFFIKNVNVKFLVIVLGVIGSIVMGFIVRTVK